MVQSMKKSIEFVSLAKTLIWSVPRSAILGDSLFTQLLAIQALEPLVPLWVAVQTPLSLHVHMRIDNLIAGMKKPDNQPTVAVHSTIIVGEKAYAEGALRATGGGFQGMPGGHETVR